MKPLLWLFLALPLAAADDASFLLRGATVHRVSSPAIENGMVLVRQGRIAEVGQKVAAPRGVPVIDIRGLHVYPGLIDSATQLGLNEINSLQETRDTTDLGLFKPQLRAAVALNQESEHIPATRANGITTVLSQPSGGIIAGQAALIHLAGFTREELAWRPSVAMRMEFPALERGRAPFAERKKRYEQALRDLDEFVEAARRYRQAKTAGGPGFQTDLRLEAMLPVIEGKLPVLVRAVREKAIREAIAFCEKQKLRMILQYGTESWKVAGELKAKNIPVTLGPTLSLPIEEDEPYDRPFTTPGVLHKAGVRFAFGSFGPGAGENPFNLPYQAGGAVPFGLPAAEALKCVTLYAAEIWGVADQIGSIEKGKLADLIVTDGDPLEIRTQVKRMFIMGHEVELAGKHQRLYRKYAGRP